MSDGTEGLHAPAPEIDARVLRHMMQEATDLLDESVVHAQEGARSTQAAMALTRAHWVLMSVHHWIAVQLEAASSASPAALLGDEVAKTEIETGALSVALRDYAERVDRLHARTRQLHALTGDYGSEPAAARPKPKAQVLHIFGDPDTESVAENPVRAARARLSQVLAGK